MSSYPRVKKVITNAVNVIFEFLKNKELVLIWLYENVNTKLEGTIVGFDEYMNIVLDNAVEINIKTSTRKPIGRILLKGDCVTLIQKANPDN